MLNLTLKHSDLDDIFKESWELCFDEQKCAFFVCHTTQYVGTEEPHVEKFPLTACCDLITEKLKQIGFVSDGKDEYVKPEPGVGRHVYHAEKQKEEAKRPSRLP